MALSEWIFAALMAATIIAATIIFLHYRRKLSSTDDFEGIVTERGMPARRADVDIDVEIKRMEKALGKHR